MKSFLFYFIIKVLFDPFDILKYFSSFIIFTRLRHRPKPIISFEENEERIKLKKEWTQYQQKLFCEEIKSFALLEASQQKALTELRKESEELYQMAIQVKTIVAFLAFLPTRLSLC